MKKRWIGIVSFIFLIAMSGLVWVQHQVVRVSSDKPMQSKEYERHYVMITGEKSEFWDQVYESARQEGEERGIYVERFGENLTKSYNKNELLKLAVCASVDGIIIPGDEQSETITLLNDATKKGIVVATVLQDSTGSQRQCFIGNSNYNLGREYGRQIETLLEKDDQKELRILVLMDERAKDTGQNLILLGIREILDNKKEFTSVKVESTPIDNTRSYSSEEAIRDIFLQEEKLPDILVCLNAVYTQCAYQAAVDYNKVGTVQILGYYDSDAIVNAVAKDIIATTITLDTDQMGRLCVQALDELQQTGYTNTYQTVDIQVVGHQEAVARNKIAEGAGL